MGLVATLERDGHVVERVVGGAAAVELVELRRGTTERFDALVLGMARIADGLAALDLLRRGGHDLPVLAISAPGVSSDRIAVLDRGADDCLASPVELAELSARVRALLRRSRPRELGILRISDLALDTTGKTAERAGRSIALSAHEFAVLECLFRHRGRAVAEPAIARWIYDGADVPASNTIAVYIRSLRRKIDGGHGRQLIHTVRGEGYLLSECM